MNGITARAFPIRDMNDHPGPIGLSIRDYFAAQAMQALLTSQYRYTADEGASAPMETWPDFAGGAYQMADAMLKERSK